MTSKKVPSAKRAVLPRSSDRTKAFAKDWTRLSHSGRYDLRRLKEVMLLLIANDAPLHDFLQPSQVVAAGVRQARPVLGEGLGSVG